MSASIWWFHPGHCYFVNFLFPVPDFPPPSLFIVSPSALMLVRPSSIIKRETFYAVYGALIKDFN